MEVLDKGQDKIQKICDALKKETLEPAQLEAEALIADARARASQIVAEAEIEGKKLLQEGLQMVDKERSIFHTSLEQASKQTLEALRQEIEHKFFNEALHESITEEMCKPKVIAEVINAVVKAVESDGLSKELSAIIPQSVSAEEVHRYLAKSTLDSLKEHSVIMGPLTGGAQVKLIDKRMTIDMEER
jgi:V/A-type H+-transporting ATPase subunit E